MEIGKSDKLDEDKLLVEPEGAPSYHVRVAPSLEDDFAEKTRALARGKVFLLTQKGLEDFAARSVVSSLADFFPEGLNSPNALLLEPGEPNKHLNRLAPVYNRLIELGAERSSLILALGGGVVGDFAGFIAATLLRGVDFVQIPTTLLAAVDSSVGGKVGVNVDRGKNMVGAFYQPRFVYFNTDFLRTLPAREWNCGLAEMVKHGFLESSGRVLEFMEENIAELRDPSSPRLARAVLDSIAVKAWVVERDEKEAGLRAVLNLGHTTAHALESATNYERFSHGEAVSRGLATMLILSRNLLGLPRADEERMMKAMQDLGLPLDTAGLGAGEALAHMKYDKKNVGGRPRFVLLAGLGDPRIGLEVSEDDFTKAFSEQAERFSPARAE